MQAKSKYAEQLKDFFKPAFEKSLLTTLYSCLLNDEKTAIIKKLFDFIVGYFEKYPTSSINHSRHQSLLELFTEVIFARNDLKQPGLKICDILHEWQKQWRPGFFSSLVYSYGECGKFVDTLLNLHAETVKAEKVAKAA